MKKKIIALIILVTALTTVGSVSILNFGCSTSAGASAPPIDIPAPITGRITISNPDESGNVTILGSTGAVTANSLVMAVNENTAGTVTWKILDAFIKTAYADDSFPSVCLESGKACGLANSEGSFTIVIPAALADSIVIGVIDSTTGAYLSELLRRIVGQTPDVTGDCSGLSLSGSAVDIALVPGVGTPVVLRQGSETGTNQLAIGYPNTFVVNVPGCYAHSIVIYSYPYDSGTSSVLVTSKNDKTIWAGLLSGTKITSNGHFSLDYEPMHMGVGSDTYVSVALKTSTSTILAKINVDTLSISNETEIKEHPGTSSEATIGGLTKSVAMDTIQMDNAQSNSLGLLLTENETTGVYYLSFFQADNLQIFETFLFSEQNYLIPTDANFYIVSEGVVKVAFNIQDLKAIATYMVENIIENISVPLDRYTDITSGSITGWDYTNISLVYAKDANDNALSLNKFKFVHKKYPNDGTTVVQSLIATTSNGSLWKYVGASGTTEVSSLVDGVSLTAVAEDDLSKSLYTINSSTQKAVDGSDYITW